MHGPGVLSKKGVILNGLITVVNVVPLSLQIAQIIDKKLQRDNKYLLSVTILAFSLTLKVLLTSSLLTS